MTEPEIPQEQQEQMAFPAAPANWMDIVRQHLTGVKEEDIIAIGKYFPIFFRKFFKTDTAAFQLWMFCKQFYPLFRKKAFKADTAIGELHMFFQQFHPVFRGKIIPRNGQFHRLGKTNENCPPGKKGKRDSGIHLFLQI